MSTPKTREPLSADGLIALLGKSFARIDDHRPRAMITLSDALKSAFALFSLKDPSLLAFDERRREGNLRRLYGIDRVPSDTRMREILDPVDPEALRPVFNDVFRVQQRGKGLERMELVDGFYLLAMDATGYFSSTEVHCDSCLEKVNSTTGEIAYSRNRSQPASGSWNTIAESNGLEPRSTCHCFPTARRTNFGQDLPDLPDYEKKDTERNGLWTTQLRDERRNPLKSDCPVILPLGGPGKSTSSIKALACGSANRSAILATTGCSTKSSSRRSKTVSPQPFTSRCGPRQTTPVF